MDRSSGWTRGSFTFRHGLRPIRSVISAYAQSDLRTPCARLTVLGAKRAER